MILCSVKHNFKLTEFFHIFNCDEHTLLIYWTFNPNSLADYYGILERKCSSNELSTKSFLVFSKTFLFLGEHIHYHFDYFNYQESFNYERYFTHLNRKVRESSIIMVSN